MGGSGGRAIGADISDPDDVRGLIREIAQKVGRLDIMVNNAGSNKKYLS